MSLKLSSQNEHTQKSGPISRNSALATNQHPLISPAVTSPKGNHYPNFYYLRLGLSPLSFMESHITTGPGFFCSTLCSWDSSIVSHAFVYMHITCMYLGMRTYIYMHFLGAYTASLVKNAAKSCNKYVAIENSETL